MTHFTEVEQAACSFILSHFGRPFRLIDELYRFGAVHSSVWWWHSLCPQHRPTPLYPCTWRITTEKWVTSFPAHGKIFPQDTQVSRLRLDYRCVTMAFSQALALLLYVIIPAACKHSKLRLSVLEKSTAEICLIYSNVSDGFRKASAVSCLVTIMWERAVWNVFVKGHWLTTFQEQRALSSMYKQVNNIHASFFGTCRWVQKACHVVMFSTECLCLPPIYSYWRHKRFLNRS